MSVNKKESPPEKKTIGETGFQSTKSGAGMQFQPLGYVAKALIKGVIITINVHKHIIKHITIYIYIYIYRERDREREI